MDVYKRIQKNKTLLKLVSKIHVRGLDKIEKLRGKQVVMSSNHLSHFDYLVLGYEFLEHNLPYPIFLAGENLDLWPFNKFWRFRDWGALFIDRDKINSSERIKKLNYLKDLESKIYDLIVDGKSLFIFPEGGRSYNGEVMENIKTGAINFSLNSLNDERMKNRILYGINIAVNYKPKRIEEDFFQFIKFGKNKKSFRFLYYFSDLAAYFSQPFRRPLPEAYINFGEPYKLNEFADKGFKGKKELTRFIVKDIKNLYGEIS